MGRGSFAHVLMFVGGGVLISLILIILGWHGWLGADIQASISRPLDALYKLYKSNDTDIERVARIIGVIVTALTGLFGMIHGYLYSERNLPNRLEAYIKNCKTLIVKDREFLLNELANSHQSTSPKLIYLPFVDQRKRHLTRFIRRADQVEC